MKPKARRASRYGNGPPVSLLPPNLPTLGALPFTPLEFAALDVWLAESGWPSESMDIAMLEGYLVALLAWPIELAPGAWLPPIWGIKGWKVAAKIATKEGYDRFIGLVAGFLQETERRLTSAPRLRTPVLDTVAPLMSVRYFAGAAWATGFMVALHDNSAGFGSRSAATRSAVEAIARHASLRSSDSKLMPSVSASLSGAVAILMDERPMRGPVEPKALMYVVRD